MEQLAELEEENAAKVVASDMMSSPTPPKKSRLQRLSMLSPLRTNSSKDPKDVRNTTLRKPVPIMQDQFTKSAIDVRSNPQSPIMRPPTLPSQQRSSSANPNYLRHSSPNRSKPLPTTPPSGDYHNNISDDPRGRPRPSGIQPPPQPGHNRAASNPMTSTRPRTANSSGDEDKSSRAGRRRSGFGLLKPGSRDSSPAKLKKRGKIPSHSAWTSDIYTGEHPYTELEGLKSGKKIPELWEERNGDVLIYLFDQSTASGPSFKLPQSLVASSRTLAHLIGLPDPADYDESVDHVVRNIRSSGIGTPPYTPDISPDGDNSLPYLSDESRGSFVDNSGYIHLYFPSGLTPNVQVLPPHDVQALVDIRNLFALLVTKPLVLTPARPSHFHALLAVAALLRRLNYTSLSGDTFGEVVERAFSQYVEWGGLPDVRDSPENTIQALVLGERMKHAELYLLAYPHAVGRYSEIQKVELRLLNLISKASQSRLERAHMELTQRQRSVDDRLHSFSFPSMFAGIASSTARPEARFISKAWNTNFFAMRNLVLSYYKDLHGQWPPKASSKKNSFVEGGLNRLVLKGLYADLCGLYDYLVDRQSFTTRGFDASDDKDTSNISPTLAALRGLLGEYDRSSPPVQPPVPFDVPLIPTHESLNPRFPVLSMKEQLHTMSQKLPFHEAILILTKSHNQYPKEHTTPFLAMYKSFEEKESQGKSCQELADQRIGHWIFLYAVIQALPLLVMDAPGAKFTEGVEYFLCQPSLGNLPWIEGSAPVKKEWYGVSKTGGMVSLPSDVVEHGIEAVYRRSHCWTVANAWLAASENSLGSTYAEEAPMIYEPEQELMSPLAPPPGFGGDDFGSISNPGPSTGSLQRSVESMPAMTSTLSPRDYQPSSRQSKRLSMAFGLEKLASPALGGGDEHWRYDHSNPGSARSTSPMTMSSGASRETRIPSDGSAKNQTFDDILKNLSFDNEQNKGNKKSDKKK